jgi:RNA polymerase sigma-70 factor (ECF subfamily)
MTNRESPSKVATGLTDAELIRLAHQGDPTAVQTLYERYLPAVWRFAYARSSGERHVAEDIVSETFLALVRQIKTLDPDGGALGGWLMTVARRKLTDVHRRRRTVPAGEIEVIDSAAPAETVLEDRELVAQAIEEMKDEEREALQWKYIESLSVRDIADRMGRSEKAVESILFRARRSFREIVERLGGNEPCQPTT